MKTSIGAWLTALAVLGTALPLNAADEPARPADKSAVTDVVLATHGILKGIVVDRQGQPVAGTTVRILHEEKPVAQVRTDRTGRYSVKGLRSGLHRVRTVSGESVCRFWTKSSAPPSAKQQLLQTCGEEVVRGNGRRGIAAGAGLFVLTSAALWASVGDDNPVIQGPPAPASP